MECDGTALDLAEHWSENSWPGLPPCPRCALSDVLAALAGRRTGEGYYFVVCTEWHTDPGRDGCPQCTALRAYASKFQALVATLSGGEVALLCPGSLAKGTWSQWGGLGPDFIATTAPGEDWTPNPVKLSLVSTPALALPALTAPMWAAVAENAMDSQVRLEEVLCAAAGLFAHPSTRRGLRTPSTASTEAG